MDSLMAATETLMKGKEDLIRLMELFENPSVSSDITHSDLAAGVSRSFHHAIHILNSGADESTIKRPAARDRRGCYKRRKSDSWNLSPTMEDGYSWRKYGQKFIHSQTFPRSYFRCTHKKEGCKAKKQVHKWEEDPSLYRTTYFGQHTCSNQPSINVVDHDLNVNNINDHMTDHDHLAPTSEEILDQYPLEDKSVVKVGGNNNMSSEVIDHNTMMWQDLPTLEPYDTMFKVGFEDGDVSSIWNLLDFGGLSDNFEAFLR